MESRAPLGARLGKVRAEKVGALLIEGGVAPERLVVRDYGDSMPIDTNRTVEGRARNRRVGFRIVEADRDPFAAVARVFPAIRQRRAPSEARNDFRPTVYWAPNVATDAEGKAHVQFSLSDAATTFRLVAEGIGGPLVGRGEAVVAARLPVTVSLPDVPRLHGGDRVQLAVTIANHGDVPVDTTLDGALTFRGLSRGAAPTIPTTTLRLPPRTTTTHWLDVNVPEDARALGGELRVTANGQVDSLQVAIPIVSARATHHRTVMRVLDRAAGQLASTFALEMPVDAESIDAKLVVAFSPLQKVLASTRDALAEPHGCFEQTTAITRGNLRLLALVKAVGHLDAATMQRGREVLAAGARVIAPFADAEGGFALYPGHAATPRYTAMAVRLMRDLRQAGAAVPVELESRAVAWLAAHPAIDHVEERIVLSELGLSGAPLSDVQRTRLKALASDAQGLQAGLVLEAFVKAGLNDVTPELVRRLLGTQRADGAFPSQEGLMGPGSADAEQTARVVLGLVAVEARAPSSELRAAIDRALLWFWGTDVATSTAFALQQELATALAVRNPHVFKAVNQRPGSVKVDGRAVAASAWRKQEGGWVLSLDPARVRGATTKVQVALQPSAPWMRVELRTSWRSALPPASRGSLAIETEWPAAPPSVGDTGEVVVRVENRGTAEIRHPMIELPLPAGIEVPREVLDRLVADGVIAHWEEVHASYVFYLGALQAGEARSLTIPAVFVLPGVSRAPAASAWSYYEPREIAFTRPFILTVAGGSTTP